MCLSPLFLFWYKNAQFTNKLWEFVEILLLLYQILFISVFIIYISGFPKKEEFTQLLLCLFSVRYQTLSPRQVSDVGLFRLVRFASSTRRRR